MSLNNLFNNKKYDLKYVISLTIIPMMGIFGTIFYSFNYGIKWQEPILLIFFWIITGLSITIGYHRLFAHRSFKSHPLLDWILIICGAAALENSALKWCSDHRRHHKYLDTEKDPYSITKGFFHAHMGWILENKPSPLEKINDLEKNPALKFQDKHYNLLFIFFGILIPMSLGFFWGRPFGALFWGVFLRITLVHHFTYFINSLCHYVGTTPYDSKCTSRDSWYMALLTFGEGFHNYHHKFQWDYRNGIRWFDFDPSKWIIWLCSKIGLAKELKKANFIQIMKAKSKNKWIQIHLSLEKMPEKMKKIHKKKLSIINNKIQSIEKSFIKFDKKINYDYLKNSSPQKLNKIYQNKIKFLKIEYASQLQSLSLLLLTVKKMHP